MAPLRRTLLRRRRTRALLLALAGFSLVAGLAWASREAPVPDAPVRPAAEIAADELAAERAAAAEASTSGAPATSAPGRRRTPSRATTVKDVPAAWRRIAAQAADWPDPAAPLPVGRSLSLPTVPAARMRDTIGLNVDLWRTEYGWRDFNRVLEKAAELRLRHARVNMQTGAEHGLSRMQALGQIGVRMNVVMGDGLGRYSTAPYATLDRRLRGAVLPYVDSLEGTNELDLTEDPTWSVLAREHQEKIVASARGRRGRPVALIAPSLARIGNLARLGDYTGLADAANAHAYSNAGEPSGPLDQWQAGLRVQLDGAPVVVTEAGFQTDLGQREYHRPLPEELAANYTPRIVLEGMRRGIPRVFLYEMVDRWDDPLGIDTSAHFGLLTSDLRPKPAWNALVRLQKALLDGGQPDRVAAPLEAEIEAGPADLRMLAFRRTDGTAALALWRAVPEWDAVNNVPTPVTREAVRVRVGGDVGGALATDVATGDRTRMPTGRTLRLKLGGAPVVVDGIR